MKAGNLEVIFLKALKRVMLVAIGSGLLGNALYIYGLGYYQGYVQTLGFEYNLFPIEWKDTLLWTYAASRELGVSSIELINQFTSPVLMTVIIVVYFIARIWMELSKAQVNSVRAKTKGKINFKIAKKIYIFKQNHIWLFRLVYLPIKWLLIKEQSFIAFAASYFFMIFIIFIPFFIIIWIYFPLFGVNHGVLVAQKRLGYYEEYLCGGSEDYWSKCIQIDVSKLKRYKGLIAPTGRVLFRNGTLIAILTKNGPITLTMPKEFYFKTLKNPSYEKM